MEPPAEVVAQIRRIPRDEKQRQVADEILADIRAGISFPVPIVHADECVGVLVYRLQGRTLWVDALFAENRAGVDLTDIAELKAEEVARKIGCEKITCDTQRLGLVKKLAAKGWQISLTKTLQ